MENIHKDTTLFKGYRWIIDNPDDAIQKHHKEGKFFEMEDLLFISQYINDGDVILDVGANVGNHAIYFNKNTNASKIIVIEPVEKIYKILLANVALNYAHNIDLNYIGFALGHTDTVGFPFMIYGKDNLGATQLSPVSIHDNDVVTFPPVNIFRGDKFFSNEKIDFIKIDVESMELLVLDGLKETILKNRPKIYIEVAKKNVYDFNNWLEKNSYHSIKEIIDPHAEHVCSNHFIISNF